MIGLEPRLILFIYLQNVLGEQKRTLSLVSTHNIDLGYTPLHCGFLQVPKVYTLGQTQ